MKPILRTPFFEFGVKNYFYGDDVLRIAEAADIAAARYDIDVLMIVPYTEIRRVAENTARLVILAPYMDLLSPGRGMADVLPEALKAAGARGAVVNHCERPMTLSAIKRTIDRARELLRLFRQHRRGPRPCTARARHHQSRTQRTDRFRHAQRPRFCTRGDRGRQAHR